jgi:periplasmic divalent cation tolerance protein
MDFIEDTGCVMVYTTFNDMKNMKTVVDGVMRAGLAACVSIHQGVISQYIWEGKIQQDNEIAVYFKTTESKMKDLMVKIKEKHKYQMPCLIAYEIKAGEKNYIEWMRNSFIAPAF